MWDGIVAAANTESTRRGVASVAAAFQTSPQWPRMQVSYESPYPSLVSWSPQPRHQA